MATGRSAESPHSGDAWFSFALHAPGCCALQRNPAWGLVRYGGSGSGPFTVSSLEASGGWHAQSAASRFHAPQGCTGYHDNMMTSTTFCHSTAGVVLQVDVRLFHRKEWCVLPHPLPNQVQTHSSCVDNVCWAVFSCTCRFCGLNPVTIVWSNML